MLLKAQKECREFIRTTLNGVKNIKNIEFPSYSAYGFSKNEYEHSHPFLEGGEDAVMERLEYYTFKLELLTGYRWNRNKSDGLDYSSKLSPTWPWVVFLPGKYIAG